jgi:electron transfer flavoprotein beta subunit
MHIVVCIKQIINPDTPAHLFQIDPATHHQVQGTQPLVVSVFDEIAVEVALQLKDKTAATVSVLSLGQPEAAEALHHTQGMGADAVYLVSDPALEALDSFGKAHVLAAALRKIGATDPVDLVLCGQQAGDVELGIVGPFLAEELGLPLVAWAANVASTAGGQVRFRRSREGGYAIVETSLPCVATITNDESNVPRYPAIMRVRRAMKTAVPTWSANDLSLDAAKLAPQAARILIHDLVIPRTTARCEFIPGESGAQKGAQLAQRMRELNLI